MSARVLLTCDFLLLLPSSSIAYAILMNNDVLDLQSWHLSAERCSAALLFSVTTDWIRACSLAYFICNAVS